MPFALAAGFPAAPARADNHFPTLTQTERPQPAPDLIIRDMEFFIAKSDEFEQGHLRVYVKNIGTAPAYPGVSELLLVEVYRSGRINNAEMFERTNLWIVRHLGPGEELVFETRALGVPNMWTGYYLGVIDRGTQSDPRGVIPEGPTNVAEKNNSMVIPSR